MKILYSEDINGNVHDAVSFVNRLELGQWFHSIVQVDRSSAVTVLLQLELQDYVYLAYQRSKKRIGTRLSLDALAKQYGLLKDD